MSTLCSCIQFRQQVLGHCSWEAPSSGYNKSCAEDERKLNTVHGRANAADFLTKYRGIRRPTSHLLQVLPLRQLSDVLSLLASSPPFGGEAAAGTPAASISACHEQVKVRLAQAVLIAPLLADFLSVELSHRGHALHDHRELG